MTEPVKIKIYGLFTLTRRGYQRTFYASLVMMAVVLAGWLWLYLPYRRGFPDPLPPSTVTTVALIDAIPYVVLGILTLQLIEALVVFRWFRRLEASPAQIQPGDAASPTES